MVLFILLNNFIKNMNLKEIQQAISFNSFLSKQFSILIQKNIKSYINFYKKDFFNKKHKRISFNDNYDKDSEIFQKVFSKFSELHSEYFWYNLNNIYEWNYLNFWIQSESEWLIHWIFYLVPNSPWNEKFRFFTFYDYLKRYLIHTEIFNKKSLLNIDWRNVLFFRMKNYELEKVKVYNNYEWTNFFFFEIEFLLNFLNKNSKLYEKSYYFMYLLCFFYFELNLIMNIKEKNNNDELKIKVWKDKLEKIKWILSQKIWDKNFKTIEKHYVYTNSKSIY